ncbi:MAG: NADPH-dependent 7-cyano-7-deazaguanine reductase QueF [Betaproteobacteria bacterium]|nr:NADPH-dependent 7-cyano-7-deazaguanine reductase QueF [Betaproteobacteria bacterium]
MPRKAAPTPSPAVATGTRAKPRQAPSAPSRRLDVFPNPSPKRDYHIHIQVPEFTCNCPLTGQPDFAHLSIDYIADKLCVELKALKMYMWSYRDQGVFHEKVTNDILDDLVAALQPRFMRITAKWFVRGGLYTNVIVEHQRKGWKPAPRVDLTQFDLAKPVA